jgi:hypothetical protein
LRLVADILDGKPPYSPGKDWYDFAITKAYEEACCRMLPGKDRDIIWSVQRTLDPDGKIFPFTRPTFFEFEKIFREQNPKLHRSPSERSLRRSLKRLGLVIAPDKRGRPKGK